ncbi:MAG TPA: hypothetical protein VLM85_11660 [Polyangiaceae bacterium]|nr:hypothetical protein [Polyangiaceae bacterium]
MRSRWLLGIAVVAACNGSITGDDAGDAGGGTDATVDVAEAGSDAPFVMDAAKDTSGPPQCGYSIRQVDDAGVCQAPEGTLDCAALDPSFDRCVAAYLHDADGGLFGALQCLDSDAAVGQAVCCNGTNPAGVILLIDPTWTCCPGAGPDGGTAACDPDAGKQCTATDGGWVCQ